MGQASGGTPALSDFVCLCLGNENDNENIENWIFCKGCINFFHRKCNFISDVEYDRIIGEGCDCTATVLGVRI